MRRLILVLLLVMLAGCGGDGGTPEPMPEPLTLLEEAANNIRDRDTFRLYVEQSGAQYNIYLAVGVVQFRFANAQYVAPETLQAKARLVLAGAAIDVDIFSRGETQWYRLPGLAWVQDFFAPGFNPATLIAEDSGFQAALTALEELEYVGEVTLEDGTPTYHLKGLANGPAVTALVVGLIQAADIVPVDVFIHRDERYPVRLILTQPETATESEPEPTTWTIDVFDLDEPAELTPPDEG